MKTAIFRVARIFQRRDEIFLALASEFFLRGFEVRDAARDFFPLGSGAILLFGHTHLFDSYPMPISDRD